MEAAATIPRILRAPSRPARIEAVQAAVTDGELLQRVAGGDQGAFEML